MASNLEVDSISKGGTTVNTDEIVDTSSNQICKAWVTFNMAGSIQDSYNVSSVTDTSTTNKLVNFATAMGNANYSVVATQIFPSNYTFSNNVEAITPATGNCNIYHTNENNSMKCSVTIFSN